MNHYSIEDLFVGQKEQYKVSISEDKVSKFQEITGDLNYLHTNADYAVSKGYKDKVIYGLLSTSFFSTIAGMIIPGERCLLKSISCDYLHPVYCGDDLLFEITVDSVHKSVSLVKLNVVTNNQHGEVVMKGQIQAMII